MQDLANELISIFTARQMGKVFFTCSGSEANDSQVILLKYQPVLQFTQGIIISVKRHTRMSSYSLKLLSAKLNLCKKKEELLRDMVEMIKARMIIENEDDKCKKFTQK